MSQSIREVHRLAARIHNLRDAIKVEESERMKVILEKELEQCEKRLNELGYDAE